MKHGFAIIRIDKIKSRRIFNYDELVIIKKIVWTQIKAEAEVIRLNKLNNNKGCIYFWQLTRIEKE